ncbi:unnamed protein product [Camellia sinensis]
MLKPTIHHSSGPSLKLPFGRSSQCLQSAKILDAFDVRLSGNFTARVMRSNSGIFRTLFEGVGRVFPLLNTDDAIGNIKIGAREEGIFKRIWDGDRFFIMVATAATAFFPVASPPPDSGAKTSSKLGGPPANVDARGIKSKSAATGGLQVKANAQAPSKVNGTKVGVMEGLKSEDDSPSLHQRTFINQLPDWSMLLAAVTTIFLALEKQWMMLDWKPRHPDMLIDPFGFGKIVENGFVFRQNFSIRAYEIGADRTASIEILMNHLQETALNHVKSAGLLGDGFGSTLEMCKKNLIWVVTKMQAYLKVALHSLHKAPADDRCLGETARGDVVQVDTWVVASGKNGMRCDWLVRDGRTGDILTRAFSVWVMMNKETRRLSKIPNEVRGEIGTFFVGKCLVARSYQARNGSRGRGREREGEEKEKGGRGRSASSQPPAPPSSQPRPAIVAAPAAAAASSSVAAPPPSQPSLPSSSNRIFMDSRKLPKLDESTADYIRNGLTPRWSDLDVNQHVNNVKYIGWILEKQCRLLQSAPLPILESHELCGMTLEYWRECGRDSVLQSLTTVSGGGVGSLVDPGYVECQHLLRLEGGAEIVKGRTEWRPKYANCVGTLGSLPAESS